MPIGLFARSVGHNASLALVATSPAARTCVASFLPFGGGYLVPAMWTDVYKLAYEQACASLASSRFQVMLQPCMN
jgi:hypothetical protein